MYPLVQFETSSELDPVGPRAAVQCPESARNDVILFPKTLFPVREQAYGWNLVKI